MPIQVCSNKSDGESGANDNLDENREIVVEGNHTLAIIRYFLDPDLVFVAIPVIYNICMDYGMI